MTIKSNSKNYKKELKKDFIIILIGIIFAIFLSKSGLIDILLKSMGATDIIGSFISGIFFTSSFTISPATVVLAHIGITSTSPWLVSIFGALGATLGDLIIFLFIRDRFAEHLTLAFKHSHWKHFFSSFHLGFMKWIAPLLGAIVIASPLPDEIGLALFGVSKMRLIVLIPLTFIMNAIGIYFIVFLSKLL